MNRNTLQSAAIPAALLSLISPAFADSVEQLEPVILSATRTPVGVDNSLAGVTVITAEDIRRLQVDTLPQLLRTVPGLDLVSSGGFGKLTSAFIRGANNDQTLLIIDGVRFSSASLGSPVWEFIPVDEIERIEIVRGPRSSLYGPDAIGGVIQIFTGKTGYNGLSSSEGGGNFGSSKFSADYSNATEQGTSYSIGGSHFSTKGYDVRVNDDLSDEPDNDGYDNTALSARLRQQLGSSALTANFLHTSGNTEFDGFSGGPNETDFTQQVFSMAFDIPISSRWQSRWQIGESRDASSNLAAGEIATRFDSSIVSASWQNDFILSEDNLLTAGVDYHDDRINSTTEYLETSRWNTGLFLEHQGSYGPFRTVAALRYDNNETYDDETNGGLTLGYDFNDRLSAFVAYGTAFKAPSFNDLYYPDEPFFHGNPNLKPEQSRNIEIGLNGRVAKDTAWNLNLYRNDIDQLIVYDVAEETSLNVEQARIDGIELGFSGNLGELGYSLSLDHVRPLNRTNGKRLPRRARNTLKLDTSYSLSKALFGASVIAQDARYDDADNTVLVAGYATLDLRAEYPLSKAWTLRANLANVFDQDYQLVDGYNTAGRTVFATLSYRQ